MRPLRKMGRQRLANFFDRFGQRVTEFLVSKMFAHPGNKVLPELFTAPFVDGFISYDSELMRAGCDKNEDAVTFACLVHPKPLEFFLRRHQWIALQLSTLNIDADLRGGFRFGLANCLHDPVVPELAQKFSCSHLLPARARSSSAKARTAAATHESAKPTSAPSRGRPTSSATTHREKYRASSS